MSKRVKGVFSIVPGPALVVALRPGGYVVISAYDDGRENHLRKQGINSMDGGVHGFPTGGDETLPFPGSTRP